MCFWLYMYKEEKVLFRVCKKQLFLYSIISE